MNPYVKALTIARKQIELGKAQYICVALPRTQAANKIRRVIMKRLQPELSLEKWLFENHRIQSWQYNSFAEYREGLRITRLAWIDSLIEEYK